MAQPKMKMALIDSKAYFLPLGDISHGQGPVLFSLFFKVRQ
jgi:hypothetical protein